MLEKFSLTVNTRIVNSLQKCKPYISPLFKRTPERKFQFAYQTNKILEFQKSENDKMILLHYSWVHNIECNLLQTNSRFL